MTRDIEILLLVVLKPRKASIIRTAALGLRTRQLLQPIRLILIATTAVRRLTDDKRFVVGLGESIVEALVGVRERDAAGGVDVDADDIDRFGAGPPGVERSRVATDVVGRPEHGDFGVVGYGGGDVFPGGDELGCGAVVVFALRGGVPVHFVAEAEVDFDALVGEFLHRGGDLGGDVGVDFGEGDPGLDRGDQDGALEVRGRDLGELRVVVCAAGDLRVLAEIASGATEIGRDGLEIGGGFGEPADGDAVLLEAATGDDGALCADGC